MPPNTDLTELAERVRYEGSPEHTDFPKFGMQPRLRADASCCPRTIRELNQVNRMLRTAIRKGAISAQWDGGFPRYVWHKQDDTVFEARLVNRGLGSYKGYPLGSKEWPSGIEALYD